MALDIDSLVRPMVQAASASLGKTWPGVAKYATQQFEYTATTLLMIEEDSAAGTITQAQAQSLLDAQKLATQNVMLALQTMSLVAIQNAINAALGAIKTAVNTAVGFTLIA